MTVLTEQDLIRNLDRITLRDLARNKPAPTETLQQLGFSDMALEGVVTGWINNHLIKAGRKPLKKALTGDTTWADLATMAAG